MSTDRASAETLSDRNIKFTIAGDAESVGDVLDALADLLVDLHFHDGEAP